MRDKLKLFPRLPFMYVLNHDRMTLAILTKSVENTVVDLFRKIMLTHICPLLVNSNATRTVFNAGINPTASSRYLPCPT